MKFSTYSFMVALCLASFWVHSSYATDLTSPTPTPVLLVNAPPPPTPTPTQCPTRESDILTGFSYSHSFNLHGSYVQYFSYDTYLSYMLTHNGGCAMGGCESMGYWWEHPGGTRTWTSGEGNEITVVYTSPGAYSISGTANGWQNCTTPPSNRTGYSESGTVYLGYLSLSFNSGISGTDNGMSNSLKLCCNSNKSSGTLSYTVTPSNFPGTSVQLSISGPVHFSNGLKTITLTGTSGSVGVSCDSTSSTGNFSISGALYSDDVLKGYCTSINGRVFKLIDNNPVVSTEGGLGDYSGTTNCGTYTADVSYGRVVTKTGYYLGDSDTNCQYQSYVFWQDYIGVLTSPVGEYTGNCTFDLTVSGEAIDHPDVGNYGIRVGRGPSLAGTGVSIGVSFGFLAATFSAIAPTNRSACGAAGIKTYAGTVNSGIKKQIEEYVTSYASISQQYYKSHSSQSMVATSVTNNLTVQVGNPSSYTYANVDLRSSTKRNTSIWGWHAFSYSAIAIANFNYDVTNYRLQ